MKSEMEDYLCMFMIRLGRFIQSLAFTVMGPNDLVDFDR
jgi:hypothetical protein